MSVLESIQCHQDIANLNEEQRERLCQEIRSFLVSKISRTGGHLASNLGVVELTVAIETVFDTATDRLVFDVGHQSYVHKLLTGRRAGFDSLRQFKGMAGFPKPSESDCDAFVAGHASSSVSIALGMARARTLMHENYHVVALLGDGAATGGMAYEGLNDAAVSNEPMIVILNDNEMSIDHNVGGMASHLSKLRTKQRYLGMKEWYRSVTSKVPGGKFLFRITRSIKDRLRRMLIPTTIFENMGFTYLGPVDGHDVENLIMLLRIARDMNRPVLLHVLTQKGHGYKPAEEQPMAFHGVGRFDPETGETTGSKSGSFSEVFGQTMLDLAQTNDRLCAITAAMPGGTGLLPFMEKYPSRAFDVGIAEEHAVSMAGGLAKQGMIPVVALYSTFLQRAYDMILQDVAMLGLHVVFAVDRAGLVGEDGETHHGVFDIGFLRQVPGMTVLCPASTEELNAMLRWAVEKQTGPVAIRYPRGGNRNYLNCAWINNVSVALEEALCCHRNGTDAVLVTYGTLLDPVLEAAAQLEILGISCGVIRLLSVSPLPIRKILECLSNNQAVIVVEEVCGGCGILEELSHAIHCDYPEIKVGGINLGRRYVTHGAVDALYKQCGLNAEAIVEYAQEVLKVEK